MTSNAAMDLEGPSNVISLKGPNDWYQWISIIKKLATTQGIWIYLDPDEPNKPALTYPEEPQSSDINPEAVDITDLTNDEFKRLEFLTARYRTNLQTFRGHQKAVHSIQQYIVKSIGSYYNTIATEINVARQLELLKARLQPTSWDQEKEVLDRYKQALKSSNRTKTEAWISGWQKVLTEAQNLGLPDTQGLRPTLDFLVAAARISPTFSDYWNNRIRDKANSNKEGWQQKIPDGIKISDLFEQHCRSQKVSENKGSFAATFQQEGNQAAGSESNKALKGTAKQPPQCLCDEKHYYRYCPYLIEQLRQPGWKPNTAIEARIQQKLLDPAVKGKVEKARTNALNSTQPTQQQEGQQVRGLAFAGQRTQIDQPAQPAQPVKKVQFDQIDPTEPAALSIQANQEMVYPLRDSFILDSGSDTHICNNLDRLVDYQPNQQREAAFAGDSSLEIKGYGKVYLQIQGGLFLLQKVAYIPTFHTNVASLDLFLEKGYNWNPATGAITKENEVIFHTRRCFRQPVIEFNPIQAGQSTSQSASQSGSQEACFQLSRQPRPQQTADAELWHQRLGHLNAASLEHLVDETVGARIKGPVQIDCEPCSLAKSKRVISRRSPQTKSPRPYWRIYIDIFQFTTSYNSKAAALLVKDEFTGIIEVFPLESAAQDILVETLQAIEARLQRQHQIGICRIHRDNDRSLQTSYKDWLKQAGIIDEPTAPYTPDQNGPAERSGGVIGSKARSMQLAANLPAELWPEYWKTAAYLYNLSPQEAADWKSPFQRLQNWLQENNRDTSYQETRPDITHLRAYGCRAYPMTKEALQGIQKRALKTRAHAEVGYLVGYDSTNIFRIWIPSKSEVRRVRDVTFNEQTFYQISDIQLVDPMQMPPQLQLPAHIESDTEDDDDVRSTIEVNTQLNINLSNSQEGSQSSNSDIFEDLPSAASSPDFQDLPTPAPSDRGSQQPEPRRSQRNRKPSDKALQTNQFYHSSFAVGRLEKPHRRSLPPEPRYWKELASHSYGPEFKQAASFEFNSLQKRGTFQTIQSSQIDRQQRPLPLTWVFKYKFNKHGFLVKFKARLCVRGDLQPTNQQETYAATLAGRSFRILMAIAAKFDLETRQLDAVNAFTNSLLDEEVYVTFPEGFQRPGWILKLLRALYGLRRSPLLWQRDLSQTFQKLGLTQCTEDPCIFNSPILTAFFYVDDIVILYRQAALEAADQLIRGLKASYDMEDLGDLRWFLGIRVLRDRPARKLWLCQDSYIEKIAARFNIPKRDEFKGNPMPGNQLQPNESQATADQIHRYQQIVGSINYIAVIGRPDIAKAAARLAEFLFNPSESHQKVANQVIEYLYPTRYLAIEFNGSSGSDDLDLQIASDAAFADDKETRKSSQGSIIVLFNGPISWTANKQGTVTTSSTEAELLAFTHTAKEVMAAQRLFQQLDLRLDTKPTIRCDNYQTIRLINSSLPRIKTALRHVDVHGSWIREAYQRNSFNISYVPSAENLADGLTKALSGQRFSQFVKQLGLVDIFSILERQENSDAEGE